MGDFEKNDTMFWKMSFQMFCRQIYQIHDSKYETDDSHDCKYLPVFISFTTDNFVFDMFILMHVYHVNFSESIFFINDTILSL